MAASLPSSLRLGIFATLRFQDSTPKCKVDGMECVLHLVGLRHSLIGSLYNPKLPQGL